MSREHEAPASGEGEPQFDRRQAIKFAVEMGPLVVFFLANSRLGIFWGTGAFMLATLAALVVSRAMLGRVPTMPMISGFFVLVFGGLTLWLQDDLFIKMKPTILNSLFAVILLTGVAFERLFLKVVFGDVMHLTDEGWRKLTIRWALFFLFLAGVNELIWRNFSTDTWVSFKVFGIMPLTFVFALAQIGLLKKYDMTGRHI